MKELVCELCKRSGVPKLTEHHLKEIKFYYNNKISILLLQYIC